MSSIQGLGRAEFRVTKVISLFVRKVSLRERGEGRDGEGKRGGARSGGSGLETGRTRESRRVAKGRKSGERGYSDKEEGSAGCVELLGIKGDSRNITNCERNGGKA